MAVVIGDAWIGRNYPVSQPFGANPNLYLPYGFKGHEGVDFLLPTGTQVIAVEAGVVLRVGPLSGWDNYGIFVELWHDSLPGQKFATLYAHLQVASVKAGQRVVKQQMLGLSDSTGKSTGPHLHFGLCYTDPQGVRLNQGNGYRGWLDADNITIASWRIVNPPSPAVPTPPDPCTAVKTQLAASEQNLAAERMENQRWRQWAAGMPK